LDSLAQVRVTWEQLDLVKKYYPDSPQDEVSIQLDINSKKVKLIKIGA